MSRWRSLLFVPGDDAPKLAKAHTRGADAIIVDLEDGVAVTNKATARAALPENAGLLATVGCDVVVRVNSGWRDVLADLEAAVNGNVTAIMVPKVDKLERIGVIAEMLAELEVERGLAIGTIGIVALIESAASLNQLAAIAAHSRVIGLALGSEDFALDLGVPPTPACLDLPCRQIALAAAPRRLMALALPVSIAAFRDEPAFAAAALLARAVGATGALCVHPSQVRIANETFTPTDAEVSDARAVLDAWAQREGRAVIALNGKMIDQPVVERARAVLDARRGE
jgi:citrate lyase subunit beta/citryl-CoA lyase